MKKPTNKELHAKIDFYEYSIEESRKTVRQALRQHNIWNQDFHENEFAAITAVFLATRAQLEDVQAELAALKKSK
tara:strand:+ start:6203 stop:6427 length:225 start_codon:yes stop_codon:yes gene_type:complete